MATDNVVTLVGNITDEPELRFTPGGAAVANFTVAVNRRFRNQDGSWDDKLDGFFRCSCWRDMAENVSESLHKGARVVVTCAVAQRSEGHQGAARQRLAGRRSAIGWRRLGQPGPECPGPESRWSGRRCAGGFPSTEFRR